MINEAKPVVILSYGMGVESHAILERWINEPECRPFESWDQLIVVTAQVGEEHLSDTVPNVERRTLPLLRKHQIRFVEVARRGAVEADGIVVLQDTRNPQRLHPEGVFKLSDELLSNGTVPQFGSTEHRCAMKFKAWVLESWMAFALRGGGNRPVCHVFGYNSDEISRIRTSEMHIDRHNDDRSVEVARAPLIVFGFNCEEVGRIERNRKYDGPLRRGCYPLLDWGWNRQKCWEYIFDRCGIDWKKSACSFCLAGDTEIITRNGIRPIGTLVGQSVELLVPIRHGYFKTGTHGGREFQVSGRWVKSPVREFGVQPVIEIEMHRGRSIKWIRATAEHRWFLASGEMRTTATLKPGDCLASCRRPLLASSAYPIRPSAIGIAQGFTFGDGCRNVKQRHSAHVPFYGAKDRSMIRYFAGGEIQMKELNGKRTPVALDIPRYWKDAPPLHESRSFLFGWLAGYFAADGDVNKKGDAATLYSAERKALEFARDVCNELGIETCPIRERKNPNRFPNAKLLFGMAIRVDDVPRSFWLIKEHAARVAKRSSKRLPRKVWTIAGKRFVGEEMVYCATVDGIGRFTLADNLVTGNCPFSSEAAKGEPCAVDRWKAAPIQTAHGLLVEFNALCFNPRGQLYKKSTMMAVVKKHNVTAVLDAFESRLAGSRWGYYRVRRIYTGIGQAIRCVERLAEGTRAEMESHFDAAIGANVGTVVDVAHGIRYAMFQRRVAETYPSAEGFFVIAPLFVATKVRGKMDKFDQRWERVVRGLALHGEAVDPKQGEMILEAAVA